MRLGRNMLQKLILTAYPILRKENTLKTIFKYVKAVASKLGIAAVKFEFVSSVAFGNDIGGEVYDTI